MSGNQTGDPGNTRDAVIDRYSGLARIALAGGDITDDDTDSVADSCFGAAAYSDADGALEAALRASLGCGNPVAVAGLNAGETVLDLGSGGGLDVLLSAQRVGPDGIAYGLDASTDMLALARANADAAGVANAVFLQGDIEAIPLPDQHVDVVISNCVVCLSADKPRVLTEAHRVLRPGGRLGISDVIADGGTDSTKSDAPEEWVGCVSLTELQYRDLLLAAGFTAINVTKNSLSSPRVAFGHHPSSQASRSAHVTTRSDADLKLPAERVTRLPTDSATARAAREPKLGCGPGSRPTGSRAVAGTRDRDRRSRRRSLVMDGDRGDVDACRNLGVAMPKQSERGYESRRAGCDPAAG